VGIKSLMISKKPPDGGLLPKDKLEDFYKQFEDEF
jgi:hypothetical protein